MLKYFLTSLLLVTTLISLANGSWQDAKQSGTAELELNWYVSRPFIVNNNGQLEGLEYDLVIHFKEFVKKRYNVDLKLKWVERRSFNSIMHVVENSIQMNVVGVSAFSITEGRKARMKFTNSYLPDITVLVSSQGTPIVKSAYEVSAMMDQMEAITVKGTIYESMLLSMRKDLGLNYGIKYIGSNNHVLDIISQKSNSFGFIDLPVYFMWLKKGNDLVRQNYFTHHGLGYGMVMPLESDWNEPFNEFLADEYYQKERSKLIAKYLGAELTEFIESLYSGESLGTSILTSEKVIQIELIKNANLKLKEEETAKTILVVAILVTILFLLVILIAFIINHRANKTLLIQRDQIEAQQLNIRRKNEQLLNRNSHLVAINEEKNYLVNILAHDLRAPVGNIKALTGIIKNSVVERMEDEKMMLGHIEEAAEKMDQMIVKILNKDNMEGKKMVLREWVQPRSVFNDLMVRYRSIAAEKDIDLRLEIMNGLEQLKTDHLLLFLIIENLLSNAIKFSNHNTLIELGVSVENDNMQFFVRDQGPGFSDDDKLKVFGKFQPLSARPTGDETSIGLGLSIVKKYVTDLGGEIWLESTLGQGSSFFVSLPLE
ncbi:MAG: ATP-binding protein [Reichenbachiella sp.]